MDAFNEPEENYKSGYIKIYRSIKNHWIYEPKRKRTKLEAWYDLLLMARHSPYVELIGYDKIPVGRGQILTSQQQLSTEFRWDRSALRLFLNSLHEDGMLVIQSTSKYTMITICNYDTYQDISPSNQQQTNNKPTTKQHQNNTYNNDNELKNDNKLNIYSDFSFFNNGFDKVWKDFLKMRITIKKKATTEAEILCLKKLSKLSNDNKELAIKIVEQSIEKSWQGLFPIKDNGLFNSDGQQTEVYTEPVRRSK